MGPLYVLARLALSCGALNCKRVVGAPTELDVIGAKKALASAIKNASAKDRG